MAQIKIIILYSNITPHGRLFAEALISGANSQEGKGFTWEKRFTCKNSAKFNKSHWKNRETIGGVFSAH